MDLTARCIEQLDLAGTSRISSSVEEGGDSNLGDEVGVELELVKTTVCDARPQPRLAGVIEGSGSSESTSKLPSLSGQRWFVGRSVWSLEGEEQKGGFVLHWFATVAALGK